MVDWPLMGRRIGSGEMCGHDRYMDGGSGWQVVDAWVRSGVTRRLGGRVKGARS